MIHRLTDLISNDQRLSVSCYVSISCPSSCFLRLEGLGFDYHGKGEISESVTDESYMLAYEKACEYLSDKMIGDLVERGYIVCLH